MKAGIDTSTTGATLQRPKGLWRARIRLKGGRVSLGYYRSKAEAAAAHKAAKRLVKALATGTARSRDSSSDSASAEGQP